MKKPVVADAVAGDTSVGAEIKALDASYGTEDTTAEGSAEDCDHEAPKLSAEGEGAAGEPRGVGGLAGDGTLRLAAGGLAVSADQV